MCTVLNTSCQAQVVNMENSECQVSNTVSKGVTNFTSDLCKIFSKSIKENCICSPLSAHIALSMASYGADGKTADEMRKVLHISDDDSKLLDDYQKIIDILQTDENAERDRKEEISYERRIQDYVEDDSMSDEKRNDLIQGIREMYERKKSNNEAMNCIATLANQIFVDKKRKLQEHYDNALHTYFRSKNQVLDFAENEQSAEIINQWCSEATSGKINDMVRPGHFTKNSALLLINAVYFKGYWLNRFETTEPKSFYFSTFKKIKVPTMFIGTSFQIKLGYRNLPKLKAQAVRLNFARSKKYMEIIVPNRINGLKYVEKNLHKIDHEQFKYYEIIRLWLPKFQVQSVITFEEHLKTMGMVEAFDEDDANFQKICDKPLFIKTVIQKAYIKVDEIGCEAAAVTQVSMDTKKCCWSSTRKPIIIKANRPFLFRIMDSRLDIPLFIGTVVNPMQE